MASHRGSGSGIQQKEIRLPEIPKSPHAEAVALAGDIPTVDS
jgi:hypothetical protein